MHFGAMLKGQLISFLIWSFLLDNLLIAMKNENEQHVSTQLFGFSLVFFSYRTVLQVYITNANTAYKTEEMLEGTTHKLKIIREWILPQADRDKQGQYQLLFEVFFRLLWKDLAVAMKQGTQYWRTDEIMSNFHSGP